MTGHKLVPVIIGSSICLTLSLCLTWCTPIQANEIADGTEPAVANPWSEILDEIDDASQQLTGIDAEALAKARSRTKRAMDRLESALSRGGEAHVTGWKGYLKWSDLETEMAKDVADPAVLRVTYEQLRQNNKGLEIQSFRNLRSALQAQANLTSLYLIPEVETYFQRQLDELRNQLTTYATDPSFETAHNIGRILGILESGHQVPSLVASIRSRFSHPNVVGWVTEDFLNASLQQPVDDTSPVSEMILGTHQTGTAHTTGEVTFRIDPNPNHAELVAVLEGVSISDNVGYRSIGLRNSLHIFSTGTTSVFVEKRILVGQDGFILKPAQACCRTHTDIHCIQAPSLLAPIIEAQVYAKKGQAEYIASQRAAARIEDKFDAQVADATDQNMNDADTDFEAIVHRLDSAPASIASRSTDDELRFEIVQAGPLQLAAPAPPEATIGNSDFGVSIHESAVNNMLESALGGKRLTRERLVEMVANQSADAVSDLEQRLGNEDWSILFPTTRPVVIRFLDNGFEITINGQNFTREEQSLRDPMEIRASYQVTATETGMVMTRQGDLHVDYREPGQRSARQVAFRSFAQEKFNLLFPETIETTGFELPTKMPLDGPMQLSDIAIGAGWATVGWNRAASE